MQQLAQQLVVSKYFTISPDKDDERSKRFKLELVIPAGTTIMDLANSQLSSHVIKVQNANRPKWDKLVEGHVYRITYKRPISEVDPMTQLIQDAKLAGVDPSDQDAMTVYIMEQIAKRNQ